MIAVRAFVLGLREVFVLEQAERRAKALDDATRSELKSVVGAARLRLTSARRLPSPVAAIVLLRGALELLGQEVAPLAHPLALDELSFADAEAMRTELEARLVTAIGAVDFRSVFAVRVTRWARVLGVVLAIVLVVRAYAVEHWMVHELATGKSVTTSPLRGDSPTPDHLLDGHMTGTFGAQTIEDAHPFFLVDLGEEHTIDHVVVVNRGDGWFDDCLPLQVELSNDTTTFERIGLRTEHFTRWTVPADGRRARFVRVSKPERGYIALNAIEVYGR